MNRFLFQRNNKKQEKAAEPGKESCLVSLKILSDLFPKCTT